VRKLLAVVCVSLGLAGVLGAATPSASADTILNAHQTINTPDDVGPGLCLIHLAVYVHGTKVVDQLICL